jgi:hypothetical protein
VRGGLAKKARELSVVSPDPERKEHVMSKFSEVFRAIVYASAASIAASLCVLLVGACVFGFHRWAEWEGGLVGVVGTVAGVVGAVIGLRIALRAPRRAAQ